MQHSFPGYGRYKVSPATETTEQSQNQVCLCQMEKNSGVRRSVTTGEGRQWQGLRQRWGMLGLFEIKQDHEFYDLTSVMKEGLHAAVQPSVENPPPEEPLMEHFESEETQIHKGFEMQTFAGPVFARLRRSLGMTEEEYQASLSSDGCYLQFISNSKSKANFFLTNDKRFFLKTQNHREVTFLLSNLKAYMDHLEKYPHSLMVRFLGVHSLLIPNQTKKYFIVMQSVFYPDERIHTRYDIKGCEVGRWTNQNSGDSHVITVLKDNNFNGKHITLAEQRSWLMEQVEIDTNFLRRLNVLDYSLLLAQQPLHQDELDGKHSFPNIITCVVKSMDQGDSPIETDPFTVPLPEKDSGQKIARTADGASEHEDTTEHQCINRVPLEEINLHSTTSSPESELQEFHAHHRRLLPDFKNSVHVIDGPEIRYFVGIVDIFTEYSWKKKMENIWKRIRYPGRAFSTVSPSAYCQRFCQWVQNQTR
ncbi:phosphatidylinositol 4-phosphate 5-kinase-like protein 1 isoform X1 [Hypomesus transpacificus]|uniref:phosphatidylinositol 4-phosphate 5-kinase-like protein 1 isoform X1 n=1 Tax=Hypomesus transpacificus TaxID=137520 RepID=UPI001F07DCC3|nr:phosphatidylinositol 4-phosphate 5-kinase-like protein 1 isoform X1 [Hypomesus transpacificus]